MNNTIRSILQAIAVGDALGMTTEFMTRESIVRKFGFVDRLHQPEKSQNHSNLPYASITDDTEQIFYLIRQYCAGGTIEPNGTAQCLLNWANETDAVIKKYIGPSSLKALKLIEEGKDPRKTGVNGTTCGAIMRTPAVVLCTRSTNNADFAKDIINCAMPTHYTSTALESAVGYGFALKAAMECQDVHTIMNSAYDGAKIGVTSAPYEMCAASGSRRVKYLEDNIRQFKSENELLDFLYYIFGTGLESEDIFAATMGIFLYARDDVWLGIRMGASLGGDTDTVACLAGAICAAYAKGHNIPKDIVDDVAKHNGLDFENFASLITKPQAYGEK